MVVSQYFCEHKPKPELSKPKNILTTIRCLTIPSSVLYFIAFLTSSKISWEKGVQVSYSVSRKSPSSPIYAHSTVLQSHATITDQDFTLCVSLCLMWKEETYKTFNSYINQQRQKSWLAYRFSKIWVYLGVWTIDVQCFFNHQTNMLDRCWSDYCNWWLCT